MFRLSNGGVIRDLSGSCFRNIVGQFVKNEGLEWKFAANGVTGVNDCGLFSKGIYIFRVAFFGGEKKEFKADFFWGKRGIWVCFIERCKQF